jgi:hypothetical protein
MRPNAAVAFAFALVVVASIGAVTALEVTGHSSGPVVSYLAVLFPGVVAALGLGAKADRIEKKVNGQMDKARANGYAAGYLHAQNGIPPVVNHGALPVDSLNDVTGKGLIVPPAAAPGRRGARRGGAA